MSNSRSEIVQCVQEQVKGLIHTQTRCKVCELIKRSTKRSVCQRDEHMSAHYNKSNKITQSYFSEQLGGGKETRAKTSQVNNGLLIRDFERGDVNGFLRCLRISFVEEFEVSGFDSDYWRRIFRRRFTLSGRIGFGFLRLWKREPIKWLVADVNGEVVGATMASLGGKTGYINQAMVHPDFRRKGIGIKLMNAILDHMKKRKLTRVILHVRYDNTPAHALCSRLGFKKFGDTVWLTANIDSLSSPPEVERAQIRDFDEKTDLDAVYELMKSSQGPRRFEIYDFKKKDLKTSLMKRIIHVSTDQKIVATTHEKVIGYVRSTYTSAKEAGTIRLYVPSEMLSIEIVEALLQAGLDLFKSTGTKTISTTVPSRRQDLIHVFEKLGFKERLAQEDMVLEFP